MASMRATIRLGRASRAAQSSDRLKSIGSGSGLKIDASSSSSQPASPFDAKKISQIAIPSKNNIFFVDKLKLVKSLEAQGVPTKAARGIVIALSEFMNDSTIKMLAKQQAEISRLADLIKNARLEEQNYLVELFHELDSGVEELESAYDRERNGMRNTIDKRSDSQQKWKWWKDPASWKAFKDDAKFMFWTSSISVIFLYYYIKHI